MNRDPFDRIMAAVRLSKGSLFLAATYEPADRAAHVAELVGRLTAQGLTAKEVPVGNQPDLSHLVATSGVAERAAGVNAIVVHGIEDLPPDQREAFLRRSNFHRSELGSQEMTTILATTKATWKWIARHTRDLARWADGPVSLPTTPQRRGGPYGLPMVSGQLIGRDNDLRELRSALVPRWALTRALNGAFSSAAPATAEVWVDLDQVRSCRPISRMMTIIERGHATLHGLAAPPGAGKTSTLLRMAGAIEAAELAVPLYVDVKLAIHRESSADNMAQRILQAILDQLCLLTSHGGIELPAGVSGCSEAPPGDMAELCGKIEEVRGRIRQQAKRPVFLLVDSAEDIDPGVLAKSLSEMAATIAPGILTLSPPHMFDPGFSWVGRICTLDYLAPARVLARDGTPDPAGVAALVDLLRQRLQAAGAPPEHVFDSPARAERIALLSGGNPSQLLIMAQSAVFRALVRDRRSVSSRDVDAARVAAAQPLWQASKDDLATLREVQRSHELPPGPTTDLLHRGAVMAYVDGDDLRFEVHPLLAELLDNPL